jgi:hypothetical protein
MAIWARSSSISFVVKSRACGRLSSPGQNANTRYPQPNAAKPDQNARTRPRRWNATKVATAMVAIARVKVAAAHHAFTWLIAAKPKAR